MVRHRMMNITMVSHRGLCITVMQSVVVILLVILLSRDLMLVVMIRTLSGVVTHHTVGTHVANCGEWVVSCGEWVVSCCGVGELVVDSGSGRTVAVVQVVIVVVAAEVVVGDPDLGGREAPPPPLCGEDGVLGPPKSFARAGERQPRVGRTGRWHHRRSGGLDGRTNSMVVRIGRVDRGRPLHGLPGQRVDGTRAGVDIHGVGVAQSARQAHPRKGRRMVGVCAGGGVHVHQLGHRVDVLGPPAATLPPGTPLGAPAVPVGSEVAGDAGHCRGCRVIVGKVLLGGRVGWLPTAAPVALLSLDPARGQGRCV